MRMHPNTSVNMIKMGGSSPYFAGFSLEPFFSGYVQRWAAV
jgi:hypothetical protein